MAEASAVSDDGSKDEAFLCVFCGQPPEEAKVLDCLHAACCRCVMGRVNEHTTVVCVSCQHPTIVTISVASLPCHHVEAASEEGGEVACSECDDEEASPAVSHCQTCGQALCEFHVSNHRRTKRTKHHVLVGVSESGKQMEGRARCQIHGEVVDLYCKVCRKPICSRCVPFGHSKHDRVALSAELVTPARLRLKKAEESSQADGELTRRLQEIVAQEEARVKTIDDSALATSEEIEVYFKGLRKQLKKREAELLSEVGRQQRRLTASSEAACREAKGMLASVKLVNMRAARGQRFSGAAAVVEEDGAVSKRVEALQQESESLASHIVEKADCSAFVGFVPSANIRSFAKALERPGGLGDALVMCDSKAEAAAPGRMRFSCRLTCTPRPGREEGDYDEAFLEAVEERLNGLEFVTEDHVPAMQSSGSASASAHSVPLRSQDSKVQARHGKLEMSCTLLSPPDQPCPQPCRVSASQHGRIVQSCMSSSAPVEVGWEFDVESCPKSVELSMNNRRMWTTGDDEVTVVGNRALRAGQHDWKAEILATDNSFSLIAGVTTSDQSYSGSDMYQLTGWDRQSSMYIRNEKYFAKHGRNMDWRRGDVLHFQLDLEGGTLTTTNSRSGITHTIDGIHGPVYPCFGFRATGRGVIISF